MLTSAKEPTPARALRKKEVMWAKWKGKEHAYRVADKEVCPNAYLQ